MAYYSPTFLSPNSNQEILESTPNEFSWQINGDTSQLAYRLYIRLNSDNSSIYDSTKTTSAVGAHVVPTSTVTAGNRYKWQVWSYYDGTNYTSSDWEIFNAIGSPTITLSATPSTEQTFIFDSRYTHPESIAVKSYKYKLYLGTDLTTAIEDSGDIYPDSLVIDNSVALEYEFEGLVSGTEYGVECIVSTQNDYEITTGIITFTSNYTYPINTNHLTITSLNTIGAIQLDWANLRQVIGVVDGSYEYLDGCIHLLDGATLTYDDAVSVEEYFTQIFYIKIPSDFVGVFLSFDDKFKIGYNGFRFYYQKGNRLTCGTLRALPTGYMKIGVKSSKVLIITDDYIEILR